MKHLKLFENKNKLWIVVFEDLQDATNSYQTLFNDQESAENFYIETVNSFIEDDFIKDNKEMLDSDLITDIEEAKFWVKDNCYDNRLNYHDLAVNYNYKLSERTILARDAKKYNIL